MRDRLFFSQNRNEAIGIKDGFAFEHEIDGAGQLDGDDGVGLEFISTHARFKFLRKRPDDLMIAFGDDGSFTEGPAEIRVAQLGAAQAFDLAGGSDGAFDETALGEKVLHGGEPVDVADFVENGQAEIFANARSGLEQRVIALSNFLGELLKLSFDGDDLGVEVADHGQFILEGELGDGVGFLSHELRFPGIAVVTALGLERGTIVGELMGTEPGQQIGAAPDKEEPLAEQRAQGPESGWINVGWRDEIAAEQVGDLFGIDAVVLVFAAVNGAQIERVSEHESEIGFVAGIGQPEPAEHAFAADGEVVAVRSDEFEEEFEVIVADIGMDEDFAGTVHEADVHLTGMEIDSAVEFRGGGIILHSV